MVLLKHYLNELYVNYIFKYYYILYQKPNWNFKKILIKSIIELVRLNYRKFNPSKDLFHSIQIQTQTYCNLDCQFCPNNKVEREHGVMSLELYEKIINELSHLNYTGEIMLYLQNEPLLDKRMVKLIEFAYKKCPNAMIGLYSNGTNLTNELLCKLFDAGLTFLRINDYSMVQANKPKKIEPYTIKSKVKSLDCFFSNQKKIKIYCYFQTITKMSNRSGLMEGVGIPTPLHLFCNRPFEQMYINFKGEALFCCNDWKFDEIMGKLNENSLVEIWTNKKYHLLRTELFRNSRIRICKDCDYTSFLFPKIVISNLACKINPFKHFH